VIGEPGLAVSRTEPFEPASKGRLRTFDTQESLMKSAVIVKDNDALAVNSSDEEERQGEGVASDEAIVLVQHRSQLNVKQQHLFPNSMQIYSKSGADFKIQS